MTFSVVLYCESAGWAGVMESVTGYRKFLGTGMITATSHKHASTMANGQAKKRSAQAGRSNGGTSKRNGAAKTTRRNPRPAPVEESAPPTSEEIVEMTAEEVRREAEYIELNNGNLEYETPGTSLVTTGGTSTAAGPNSNAAEPRLRTGLSGVESSVLDTETNATDEDCGYTQAQVNDEIARIKSYNVTKFVKVKVFPILKFVSGKKTLEYGQWASEVVLDYLELQGTVARSRKWEEIKKVVNEALNTRRNDCTSAMRKKFIGKRLYVNAQKGTIVCSSTLWYSLDEHYHRKREGRAMPNFSQLFDLEDYENRNTTIRDNNGTLQAEYIHCR